MSNTTDKNKSIRTPLAYLSNSRADSIDSGFYTENSNSKLTFGAEPKKEKLQPSSQSTSGISAFNRQEHDEYTKTLKKALKEAMDENSEVIFPEKFLLIFLISSEIASWSSKHC